MIAIVEWSWEGRNIQKKYNHPLGKALLTKDLMGIVIIASTKDEPAENAAIYNADGSVKFRLKVPFDQPSNYSFYDIYYIDDHLNIILWSSVGDYNMQCFLNPAKGEMTNCRKVK
jgi:hypothetical protein